MSYSFQIMGFRIFKRLQIAKITHKIKQGHWRSCIRFVSLPP